MLEGDGDGDDEMGLDPLSNLIKNHLNISAASNKSSQEVASQQNQAWQNLVAKQEASSPQSSVATVAAGSRSFNIKQEPTESVQVMNARSGLNCFLLFHFLSGKSPICPPAHRCKKKNYKPLCSAIVIVIYQAYLALAGLMNLLAQLSNRIIHFSEYNLREAW